MTLTLIPPQRKELGPGFAVQRLLPSLQRQAVGPFLFFDHFGPVEIAAGHFHDVRPHPHIGLATVTYMFEGAMLHRDSVGSVQRIEPGAINLMLAGRGIVHSERTPEDLQQVDHRSHGLQLWLGLPTARELDTPWFSHTAAELIPALSIGDAQVRVLIGTAFGVSSPVPVVSETLYLDVSLPAGATFDLPQLAAEQALYAVSGKLQVDAQTLPAHTLALIDQPSTVMALTDTRFVIIGGAPLDGRRLMSWNFVASRKELIVQAAADWEAGRFAKVPGETEWIPLPEGLKAL